MREFLPEHTCTRPKLMHISRLVNDIRSGDAASGMLSKVWDFDMRDREEEFKDDLREASGVGKKRGRKVCNDFVPSLEPYLRGDYCSQDAARELFSLSKCEASLARETRPM